MPSGEIHRFEFEGKMMTVSEIIAEYFPKISRGKLKTYLLKGINTRSGVLEELSRPIKRPVNRRFVR